MCSRIAAKYFLPDDLIRLTYPLLQKTYFSGSVATLQRLKLSGVNLRLVRMARLAVHADQYFEDGTVGRVAALRSLDRAQCLIHLAGAMQGHAVDTGITRHVRPRAPRARVQSQPRRNAARAPAATRAHDADRRHLKPASAPRATLFGALVVALLAVEISEVYISRCEPWIAIERALGGGLRLGGRAEVTRQQAYIKV